MLRHIMITGTAICLSMGSSLARADHDRELRYVVGGAILGAALGELVYATDRRGHMAVGYGYGYAPSYGYAPGYGYVHRYGYRPGYAYPAPRHFAGRGHHRSWGNDYRHGQRHGSRHRGGRNRH